MWKDFIVFSLAIKRCFSKCPCIVYAVRKSCGQIKDFQMGSNYTLCIDCMALFSNEIVLFILICWRSYLNMSAVHSSKGLQSFTFGLFFKVLDYNASFTSWFRKTYNLLEILESSLKKSCVIKRLLIFPFRTFFLQLCKSHPLASGQIAAATRFSIGMAFLNWV